MANALDNLLRFHSTALEVRAARQELLSSNIANADTPGYLARDVDFGKTLQQALDASAPRTGSPAPSPADTVKSLFADGARSALYRVGGEQARDGNTVDMNVEQAKFAENAIHYEATITFINSQLKMMMAALQSTQG